MAKRDQKHSTSTARIQCLQKISSAFFQRTSLLTWSGSTTLRVTLSGRTGTTILYVLFSVLCCCSSFALHIILGGAVPRHAPLFFHLYICQHTQSQELCYLVLIDGIIHAAMPRTAGQACFVYARQGDWAGCVDAVIKKDCTGYQEEGANGKLFRRLHVRLSYHNLSLAC